MKGGGLTWVGWGMLGVGAMLVYAGMTGQSIVGELSAVLNGKSPAAPDHGGASGGSWGSEPSSTPSAPSTPAPSGPVLSTIAVGEPHPGRVAAASRAIPWPEV